MPKLGFSYDITRRFDDWQQEGQSRFGIFNQWWFICPKCGFAHTPDHLDEIDDDSGCNCPTEIGGCGFPMYGAKTLREYCFAQRRFTVESSGTVGIIKDGPSIDFRVLPFCPDDLIPEDGKPRIVIRETQTP